MPSSNLELVRAIYADWERGDFSSSGWAHPDIEFVFADGPDPGSWKGLEGMAEANRNWLSAWSEVRQEVDDYREIDEHTVLVLHRFGARGKRSGLKLERMRREGAGVFHLRDGRVVKIVHYFDRQRALAKLGLTD
jgi:ketosteroid isomerase-like protein